MNSTVFLPPEWVEQDAVLLAWPHEDTDWEYMLNPVLVCYKQIARAILEVEPLIVVTPNVEQAKSHLSQIEKAAHHPIRYFCIPTNDTWARDFGPLTLLLDGKCVPLDFKFDAWGMKFAADKDNLITSRLAACGLFKCAPINHRDFVLEGGSIESDGEGTLLTTSSCLLSPNRNATLDKDEITDYLKQVFGMKQVLWIEHGEMPGDDTDGHIDTLARFAPGRVILYNAPLCPTGDIPEAHRTQLQQMEAEIKGFVNAEGVPYRLMPLPVPEPIFDEEGKQLPATYANFLVINGRVLVPTYQQPDVDQLALSTIEKAFPHHEIVGIDCTALIQQHGSLHCITMQFPKHTLQ